MFWKAEQTNSEHELGTDTVCDGAQAVRLSKPDSSLKAPPGSQSPELF